MNPIEMFEKMNGTLYFPAKNQSAPFNAIHAPTFTTKDGIPYLKDSGVILINQPDVCINGLADFLKGFDPDLDFNQYMEDPESDERAAQLIKLAGQLCYMSFGPQRSKNAEIEKYLNHIKESMHGSVVEHASYTFLIYGIDRSVTHELVRHRLASYSQVSQRYVNGKILRFVKRPEYENNEHLTQMFETWIQKSSEEYDTRANLLLDLQANNPTYETMSKTERRKAVNQAARACLPNETEAPIIFSANVRTLRHVCEMRVSKYADVQIRRAFFKIFLCLAMLEPTLFSDYKITELPDGTFSVETPYKKI